MQSGQLNVARPLVNYMCAAALEYAERGWHVFPVPPGEKKSYLAQKYTGTPWGSTIDPRVIRSLFVRFPDANIGIVTGLISGIFVLEADTVEGHDVDGLASITTLEDQHGLLPDTLMAISPSGSVHRYYRHPGGKIKNSAGEIAPGVDVRGDGGMVLAPPSIKPGGGVYRWANLLPVAEAPDWLIEAAREKAPTEHHAPEGKGPFLIFSKTQNGPSPSGVQRTRNLRMRTSEILDVVYRAKHGDHRNKKLYWAARCFAELIAETNGRRVTYEIAETMLLGAARYNGHLAKHGQKQTEDTIRSGLDHWSKISKPDEKPEEAS